MGEQEEGEEGTFNATDGVVCATHGRGELGPPHFSRVRRTIESVATISVPLPSILRKSSFKSRSQAYPQRFRPTFGRAKNVGSIHSFYHFMDGPDNLLKTTQTPHCGVGTQQ